MFEQTKAKLAIKNEKRIEKLFQEVIDQRFLEMKEMFVGTPFELKKEQTIKSDLTIIKKKHNNKTDTCCLKLRIPRHETKDINNLQITTFGGNKIPFYFPNNMQGYDKFDEEEMKKFFEEVLVEFVERVLL